MLWRQKSKDAAVEKAIPVVLKASRELDSEHVRKDEARDFGEHAEQGVEQTVECVLRRRVGY